MNEENKQKVSKDHELLIRIDERIKNLSDKINNIESIVQKHKTQSDENKIRLNNIELCIYGTNDVDGIFQKVEKHDKLITKAIAYVTIILVILEIIVKYLFKGI